MSANALTGVSVYGEDPPQTIVPPSQAPLSLPPPLSVLAYFDGTPSLAAAYQQSLLGFAERRANYPAGTTYGSAWNPSWNVPGYLAVVETTDAQVFQTAVSNGSYDVLVAFTSDHAAVEQWSEDILETTSMLTVFYPDSSSEGGFRGEILSKKEIALSPPAGNYSPSQWTWTWNFAIGSPAVTQPEGELGEATATASAGPVISFTLPLNTGTSGSLTATMGGWLESLKDNFLNFLINLLNKIAELIQGLEHTEISVEYSFEGQVSGSIPGVGKAEGKATVKVNIKTTADDMATLAKRIAKELEKIKNSNPTH